MMGRALCKVLKKVPIRCRQVYFQIAPHPKSNRIAVYTAISGAYDNLLEPLIVSPGCDYICFTDNPALKSKNWKIRPFHGSETDPVRKARCVKILPHKFLKPYRYSIWVDANFRLNADAADLIEKYLGRQPMACFAHPERDCIYDEAKACIEMQKDQVSVINRQIDLYRQEGYPEHNGLIVSSMLIREHHDAHVKKAMKIWWSYVRDHSKRDQLSFNYAVWKTHLDYENIGMNIYHNPFLLYRIHDCLVNNKPVSRPVEDLAGVFLPRENTGSITFTIDSATGKPDTMEIIGWAFAEGCNTEDCLTYLTLVSAEGQYIFDTVEMKRPDVTAHFHSPNNYDNAGFCARIPRTTVKKSNYHLGLCIKNAENVFITQTGMALNFD